jgi:hypothetical protein
MLRAFAICRFIRLRYQSYFRRWLISRMVGRSLCGGSSLRSYMEFVAIAFGGPVQAFMVMVGWLLFSRLDFPRFLT